MLMGGQERVAVPFTTVTKGILMLGGEIGGPPYAIPPVNNLFLRVYSPDDFNRAA